MNDTVSRQAAIDAVSEACAELRGVFGRCEDALNALPSAQPERPPGKWIEESDGWDGSFWTCSACGESMEFTDGGPEENGFDYCPHCGAKMEGVDALPGL